jgi:hypothetical protein
LATFFIFFLFTFVRRQPRQSSTHAPTNATSPLDPKFRLKCLWSFLQTHSGIPPSAFPHIQSQIEDLVVKSVLSAHGQTQQEFLRLASESSYNCYKILGYDVMLDAELTVHLLEINARPALLDNKLDKYVNRPMVMQWLLKYSFLSKIVTRANLTVIG